MKLILSAPSKTFLLGEYAVLAGCPALILNTKPRFELHVTEQASFSMQNIEPQSPAGRFIQDNLASFQNYHLNFIDPHNKQGGFGASSAQFLLAYSLYYALQNQALNSSSLAQHFSTLNNPAKIQRSPFNLDEFAIDLLTAYQQYAWNGVGISPSGADVISQLYGGITWLDKMNKKVCNITWPFPDLTIVLIRTGVKIATHEHLQQLSKIPQQSLASILNTAYQALIHTAEKTFLQTINNYSKTLQAHHLVANSTVKLLEVIISLPYVLAAKGCGALGADVILAITKSSDVASFQKWLSNEKLLYQSLDQLQVKGLLSEVSS